MLNATTRTVYIDAGIEHIHTRCYDKSAENSTEILTHDIHIKNNDEIRKLFQKSGIMDLFSDKDSLEKNQTSIFITGKLADIVHKVLKRGEPVLPAAALWAAAKFLLRNEMNKEIKTVGILDLSASGYMVITVDQHEKLKDGQLIVNPRCGAGTGINLNRILEKLDIDRDDVDQVLANYLGEEGAKNREQIPTRSDRCGVFSSSATVSDKNQGIPLDYALAVTMKSEVMKPCSKLSAGTDKVYLAGGVFRWQYARDCAQDFLRKSGVKEIVYETNQPIVLTGLKYLVQSIGKDNFRSKNPISLRKTNRRLDLPSFNALKFKYEENGIYKRMPDEPVKAVAPEALEGLPVNIGLDIGSTMAKIVLTDAVTGELLKQSSYNNHGDTIETIKHIFRELKSKKITKLKIQHIGVTGSGRYQVQKALKAIYPHMEDRIFALVENYAHARGSIQYAKEHIAALKQKGVNCVNEDYCLLVDIGGEDTKISVISLKKEELFDNAMNIKCSAGTGSLMDTLKALFNIQDIAAAYNKAFEAEKAYGINATCAVFLMENARKMQAEGYKQDEILASCCYAIVENMARSLWDQIDFPQNAVVLLHGQTMLSDPLPLAVTYRVQEYTDSETFCLVPPLPGHRACFGLVKSIQDKNLPEINDYCRLDDLLEREFDKKIIFCHGAACGDKNARCARTKLTSKDESGVISLTLGGCTAVNELVARKQAGEKIDVPESYKEIWKFVDSRLPRSPAKNRLVIPRCFAVSEKAFFFAKIFQQFGIPVHVDNVQEKDVLAGQPLFTIDTCAPNIGAAGQFLRLASEPHGIILVPQIDFLTREGESLGRTCTTNQGGVLIAFHFALMKYPEARFKVFDVTLDRTDPHYIADQLYNEFQSVFDYYAVSVSKSEFVEAIVLADAAYTKLKAETANLAADFIEEAVTKKLNISVISAREYILNPGIYDSHVGKLLKDRNVVAIPAYALETGSDNRFDYVYWKNPHDLLTRASAIADKRLHKILLHPRLQRLLKKIETGQTDTLLSIVTVSTFRCGPDSITLPILAEITKNMPSLLIQSDAMIAELAHLENRVNTHLNQLKKKLHHELAQKVQKFSIELLDEFSLDGLNKGKDVLYFPTANDNRAVTAAIKAAGFTVVDNYDDDSYDLEARAKVGRKYVGDSLCVPLAAVFADMLNAVNDFAQRKTANDPAFAGKERVVLFMYTGDGPCRQGQYVEMCKLNFYRMLRSENQNNGNTITFLENKPTSLHDRGDYLADIEKWTMVQAFHGLVVKGVLHQLYFKASSNCREQKQIEQLERDYRALKKRVLYVLEHRTKPGKIAMLLVDKIEQKAPVLGGVAQYFGYGLYNNNGLRKLFEQFGDKWIRPFDGAADASKKINIHIEGEIYLRVAQADDIHRFLIDALGFGSFNLTYTPMWSFFEYMLESRILIANKNIELYRNKLKEEPSNGNHKGLQDLIEEQKDSIKGSLKTIRNLRHILAGPLYTAAGIEMPEKMKNAIAAAKPVLPKYKPFGELVPYVGETISQLKNGTNLVLNVAPEGCMVASMGEMLTPKMKQIINIDNANIQYLFTTDGEVNEELLELSLLKILGPEQYYSK